MLVSVRNALGIALHMIQMPHNRQSDTLSSKYESTIETSHSAPRNKQPPC